MGLGCAGGILRDAESAAAAFDAILKLDIRQMELDDWRALPADDSKFSKAELEKERERLERLMQEAQAIAAKHKADVLEAAEVVRKAKEPVGGRTEELLASETALRRYGAGLAATAAAMLIAAYAMRRMRKRQGKA